MKTIQRVEYGRLPVARPFPSFERSWCSYMAYWLRAKVQFVAIKKIYSGLSTQKAVLAIDHKQKVSPVAFREGRLDYIGKPGVSLLGAMLVRRVESDDVLVYVLFDSIFKSSLVRTTCKYFLEEYRRRT
jgi:hypothetical protein